MILTGNKRQGRTVSRQFDRTVDSESTLYIWQDVGADSMSWQLSSSLSSSFIVKKKTKQTHHIDHEERSCDSINFFVAFFFLFLMMRCWSPTGAWKQDESEQKKKQKIWQKKNYYKLVENLLCVALLHFPICIFHGLLYFYKIFTFSFSFFTDRETLILNLFFSRVLEFDQIVWAVL